MASINLPLLNDTLIWGKHPTRNANNKWPLENVVKLPIFAGIGVAPLAAIGGTAAGNGTAAAAPGAIGGAPNGQPGAAGNGQPTGGQQSAQQPVQQGGRRPKLSEKMKSLSLDCAEMPPPVQPSFGRNQQYFSELRDGRWQFAFLPLFAESKPIRSARGFAASGDSFEDASERSMSPPATRAVLAAVQPRRLPPAPPQQVATAPTQPQSSRQQNGTTGEAQRRGGPSMFFTLSSGQTMRGKREGGGNTDAT